MANYPISWKMDVGVNHVPAYQVSGRPFASGNIDAMAPSGSKVDFPTVTRWVYVVNHDQSSSCRVGFSQLGVNGAGPALTPEGGAAGTANYWFLVATSSQSARLEFKVSEIWLSGSHNVDVIAGLTSIQPVRVSSGSSANPSDGSYPSWSGSLGVG